MVRKAWIYKITSPTGKIYIGSTINYRNRFSKYKALSCTAQTKLYASFVHHGFEKHSFEVLLICTSDVMFELEYYFGLMYNVLSRKRGLNIQLPKVTDKYSCLSQESRDRKSAFMKGRPFSESARLKMIGRKASAETRQRLRDSHLGIRPSAETIEKSRRGNTGKKRSAEFCQLMKDINKGKKMTANMLAATEKYRQTVMKKVIDTTTGKVFKSIAEASKFIGKSQPYVAKMLNGHQRNNTPLVFLSKFIQLQKKPLYNGNLLCRQPVPANLSFGPLRLAAA